MATASQAAMPDHKTEPGMRLSAAFLTACVLLGGQAPLRAEEESAVTKAAKQAGSDAKKMGSQVGREARKVGKDIGTATTRTAKTTEQEFKEDFVEGKDNDPPPKKRKVDHQGRK
jgi:hypothetical protein